MKLTALRVREVGCFREGVAIEGLTGEFDVLAGRNEAGKSTLFRALETLFSESYKTEGQKLREVLTPYGGGAPVIEAEIEVGGARWRYRKQYFAGRMAELEGGGNLYRNADAEARMSELIGGAAHRALLWIGQGDTLAHMPPAEAGRDLLRAAISQEVAAAAGGRRGETVRRAAAAELDALVSQKQQRPRGAYKASRDRLAEIEQDLAAADAEAAAADAHLQELARLRAEAALIADPAPLAARQQRLEHLVRQLADDDRLAADIAAATERRDHLAAQLKQVEDEHRRLRQTLETHDRLSREIAEAVNAVAGLTTDIQALRERSAAAAQRHAQARDLEQRCAERVAEAGARAEAQRLAARLAEGEAVAAKREALAARLAGNRVTPLLLDRIEAEMRAILLLEDRLKAAAPLVEIELAPRAVAPFLVDGQPLAASKALRPATPLTLAIPGVAKIRISPPLDTGQDLAADVEAHLQTLTGLLDTAGVEGIAAARLAARERAEAERAIAGLDARLLALTPEGLDAVRRMSAAMPGDASSAGPAPSPDELKLEHAGAKSALSASAAEEAAATASLNVATTRMAVEEARIEERRTALAKLGAELPGEAERDARIAAAKTGAADLKNKASEAAEAVIVLSRRRLDASERQRLGTERAGIAAEDERMRRRQSEIERESARLEGLIERDAEGATSRERDRLAEEVALLRREVAGYEAEIAGLMLLEQTLAEVGAQGLSVYLRPILGRIAPHLASLLEAPALTFSSDLGLASIERGGRTEPAERLSAGTREQLAVLVRIAYGDILAASGRPAPLVLDDALVYSDDERLVKMLGFLRKAAKKHQVILLSCRTRVMAEAGFRPLELRPWRL